ncbi:hypothetical protein M378DRAFT_960345 [Amanita muscaria Koide BX008]|uniref:Uncharacterized protein n=1 Tax=Amanita muscaria (strain Koide BX008) TaxID=946122 RepID=A0A0C2WUK5_AMAMK|nr:hypothetical protein M378DRAFT_960345 [Amanita muscaria Koide BX008]
MILYSQPYLVAAVLQAFLYVIYLVSSVYAFRWLLYEEEGWTLKSRDNINWGLLTITFVVFVFTTVDLAFEIGIQLTVTGGEPIASQLVIGSISVECAAFVITDALLIIRCWLVYQRSWRAICFPLILWLANVVFMVNYIVNYTLWTFVSEVPYHRRARIYLQLFSSCNFVTNLYATSAIVYRLWHITRASSSNRRLSILYRICRIVATTGILYTWTCLPLLATVLLLPKDLGAYLLFDALNFSMAGITFNLFLIRVGQLRSEMHVDGDTHNADANLGEK